MNNNITAIIANNLDNKNALILYDKLSYKTINYRKYYTKLDDDLNYLYENKEENGIDDILRWCIKYRIEYLSKIKDIAIMHDKLYIVKYLWKNDIINADLPNDTIFVMAILMATLMSIHKSIKCLKYFSKKYDLSQISNLLLTNALSYYIPNRSFETVKFIYDKYDGENNYALNSLIVNEIGYAKINIVMIMSNYFISTGQSNDLLKKFTERNEIATWYFQKCNYFSWDVFCVALIYNNIALMKWLIYEKSFSNWRLFMLYFTFILANHFYFVNYFFLETISNLLYKVCSIDPYLMMVSSIYDSILDRLIENKFIYKLDGFTFTDYFCLTVSISIFLKMFFF